MAKIKIPLSTLGVGVEKVSDFEYGEVKGDEAAVRYLVEKEQFRPVKLYTNLNDYAGKIEFGVNPGDEPLSEEDIRSLSQWITGKLGIFDDKARKAKLKSIVAKYRKFGSVPRPWFRPAIYSVFDNLEAEFDNGAKSFYDLATEMKERAQRNLDTIMANYTGALRNSLTVDYLTEEEYRRVMAGQLATLILEEYWSRYRTEEEVIPNDDDRAEDKRKSEWPA